MKGRIIQRRYAEALINAVVEEDLNDVVAQFREFVEVIETNEAVHRILRDQTIERRVKHDALQSLGQKAELHPVLIRLLEVVVHNRKTAYLLGMAEAFARLVDDHFGRVVAHATVASKLTKAEITSLESKLSEITGKTVRVEVEVSKEILGGVAVKIENFVIDKSLRTALKDLKEKLVSA